MIPGDKHTDKFMDKCTDKRTDKCTNKCTHGQIFTQYSGISSHSMGAHIVSGVLNNILLKLYFTGSDSYSDCFIPINCIFFLLMICIDLMRVRSIILCLFTQNLYQSCTLLFHQIQCFSTYYIELKSNGSTRTNMPMPTCSLFCPLLPLQDYLLQGW